MSDNSYFNYPITQQISSPVKDIEPGVTPDGVPNLLRTPETGDKVYLVKDGLAHWITSPEVLQTVGGKFEDIQEVKRDVFKQVKVGERLTMDNASSFILPPKEEAKAPTEEFKTYEEVPGAPKAEPEKGFTSIIMPVYWVHYPSFHYTGNAIGSIREHTDKEKTPYEIILVINGGGIKIDDLRLTYADKVIQNEENLGFAKSVNQGIRMAKGEYIAIVNNDVMVFNGWLSAMQDTLDYLDLVMATPMYGSPFARGLEAMQKKQEFEGRLITESFSDFVDFSCVLTRKEMFDKIGLFDEQFFMYGEDLDLMRRMKQKDLKYASTKLVNTFHIISGTASGVDETPKIMDESKEKLKAKWGY